MSKAKLKSVHPAAESRRPDPKPNPKAMLSVAEATARSAPPKVTEPVEASESVVQLNLKIPTSLADEIAIRAADAGITQKALVYRALGAYGLQHVPGDELDARPPKRRGRG
jgi:hypothetical protein